MKPVPSSAKSVTPKKEKTDIAKADKAPSEIAAAPAKASQKVKSETSKPLSAEKTPSEPAKKPRKAARGKG
jgi:hypothetical protein